MIVGIGIDIIEIERIERAATNSLERIFTEREERICIRKNNLSTIAGSFAARSHSKALGTGMGKIGWHDIEVLRYNKGKPYGNCGRAKSCLFYWG